MSAGNGKSALRATVAGYQPQPLRVWEFDVTPDREVAAVSVQIDEQFTVSSRTGASVSLTVAGVMEGTFEEQQELFVDLALAGLFACAELRIVFHGTQHGCCRGRDPMRKPAVGQSCVRAGGAAARGVARVSGVTRQAEQDVVEIRPRIARRGPGAIDTPAGRGRNAFTGVGKHASPACPA